jgi:hypothetical protein
MSQQLASQNPLREPDVRSALVYPARKRSTGCRCPSPWSACSCSIWRGHSGLHACAVALSVRKPRKEPSLSDRAIPRSAHPGERPRNLRDQAVRRNTYADWLHRFDVHILIGVRLRRHYLPGMERRNGGRGFISREPAIRMTEMIHYGMKKSYGTVTKQ